MQDSPKPPLTPEQRRTRLVQVYDAATRANRATRRAHATEARRQHRAGLRERRALIQGR